MSELEKLCKHEIDVTVSYDEVSSTFNFNYCNSEGGACASFEVEEACTITYNLVDKTSLGLSFFGVAFSNPFNGVITKAFMGHNNQSITLVDPYDIRSETQKSVSFEFMFSHKKSPSGELNNNLLIISKDPQVSNKSETCPPPGH